MTISEKKEALDNSLSHFGFPKKYFIVTADKRIGHKFSLGSNSDHGGVNIHSNYMTYDEFNAYLKGWYDAKMNKF